MADKPFTDRKGFRPGTPDEVIANIARIADQKGGRSRRLFNSKGRQVDPASRDDVEAVMVAAASAETSLSHIYKRGFPASTPHELALDEAVEAARAYGQPLSAEIVETDEHKAAGEYLVKVLLLDGGKKGRAGR